MPPLPWRTSRPVDPAVSYAVAITKLPLQSHLRIPSIMLATVRIMRQLKRSEGLVGYALKADLLRKTFWTMSAWHDRDALTAFVRSDVHRKAMTTLQPHMDHPQIKTYDARGSEVPPTWPDLARELA